MKTTLGLLPIDDEAGHWDDLGGDVDLTAYATKEAATYETKADASATKTELLEEIARVEQAAAEGAAGAVHKMVAVNNELTPAGGKVVWEVAHNYGADVEVTIKEVATGAEVVADVIQGSNLLTIKMNSEEVVPANTYRVIIMGVAFEPMSEKACNQLLILLILRDEVFTSSLFLLSMTNGAEYVFF